MKKIDFFRGATCYEGYIGRLWFTWPYWRFMRCGSRPAIGWDSEVWR